MCGEMLGRVLVKGPFREVGGGSCSGLALSRTCSLLLQTTGGANVRGAADVGESMSRVCSGINTTVLIDGWGGAWHG